MVRIFFSIFLVIVGQCLAKADDAELGAGIYGISLGENHEIAAIFFNERNLRGKEINWEFLKEVFSKNECTSKSAPCETLSFKSYLDDYSAKNPKWKVGEVTLYKVLERRISVELLLESIEKHFGKLQNNGETEGEHDRTHHFYRSTVNLAAKDKKWLLLPKSYWFHFNMQFQNVFTKCDYKGQLIQVDIYSGKISGKADSFRIDLSDNGLLCDAKVARDAHILKLENDTTKELSFD